MVRRAYHQPPAAAILTAHGGVGLVLQIGADAPKVANVPVPLGVVAVVDFDDEGPRVLGRPRHHAIRIIDPACDGKHADDVVPGLVVVIVEVLQQRVEWALIEVVEIEHVESDFVRPLNPGCDICCNVNQMGVKVNTDRLLDHRGLFEDHPAGVAAQVKVCLAHKVHAQ